MLVQSHANNNNRARDYSAMAAQKDMQDLLRLLTTGRNKLSMLAAMGRVKALQVANFRSIADIAASTLPVLKLSIPDEKVAKSLLAASKAHIKSGDDTPGAKRRASETLSSTTKRQKSAYELATEPETSAELEASLALPQSSADEEAISKCSIYTNRAPLVLAFAVALLKYTMPEQPLSSRLSLGQAVVSVNSRSKAVSLGIEKGKSADEEVWGNGQPKIRVMGREITVLKRGGYEWQEQTSDVIKNEVDSRVKAKDTILSSTSTLKDEPDPQIKKEETTLNTVVTPATTRWTVSAPVTLKQSRFVARSTEIAVPSDANKERSAVLSSNGELRDASHNITAWRVKGAHGIIEGSDDDGESGGGRHLLGLLQTDNIVNVLLLVTRWYGGIMLGTDRWRLMSQVSRDALSQRLRVAGVVGQEALWGLDLEAMKSTGAPVTGGTVAGMPIYKPQGARAYIIKSFGSPPASVGEDIKTKKKSGVALDKEREENLGLLLGALDLLFASWTKHVSCDELDRKAWGWYVQVRPDVESGAAGWGGKGVVKLEDILNLRRK